MPLSGTPDEANFPAFYFVTLVLLAARHTAALSRDGANVVTAITIGYDVSWREVHKLLIASAEGAATFAGCFYAQYKLIVTTKHPERRIPIRSNLHQNIQDNFAKAGVEIMSPHFQGNRSGEDSTIPGLDGID